jgi:ribosome maturation factor RimP
VQALVEALIEPLVHARRCTLYDLELTQRGAFQMLRVVIDRPGGVDSDTCATVSRMVSRALDDADFISGSYTLEVSSPGLERALRRPDHFVSAATEKVTARVKARSHGSLVGILAEADDQGLRLETSDGNTVHIGYGDVLSARTVFTWPTGSPKPGRPKGARL